MKQNTFISFFPTKRYSKHTYEPRFFLGILRLTRSIFVVNFLKVWAIDVSIFVVILNYQPRIFTRKRYFHRNDICNQNYISSYLFCYQNYISTQTIFASKTLLLAFFQPNDIQNIPMSEGFFLVFWDLLEAYLLLKKSRYTWLCAWLCDQKISPAKLYSKHIYYYFPFQLFSTQAIFIFKFIFQHISIPW